MEPFIVHTGIAAPLRRSDVDTDQIFPGRFGATHSRTGFGDALFGDWRTDPLFVLNRPAYRNATILVTGENFGTGSSREHAVWAMQDFGFRAVISPRFGDIFRANALMAGLLTVTLPIAVVERLWYLAEQGPATEVTVDLKDQSVRARDLTESFTIEADIRARLMAGLGQIEATLRHMRAIAAYESRRRPGLPTSTALVKNAPPKPGSTGRVR